MVYKIEKINSDNFKIFEKKKAKDINDNDVDIIDNIYTVKISDIQEQIKYHTNQLNNSQYHIDRLNNILSDISNIP